MFSPDGHTDPRKLGLGFRRAFPAKHNVKKVDVGTDEDRAYAEEDRRKKTLAGTCLLNPLFVAMMRISNQCKSPLSHLMRWMQKAKKEYNQNVSAAKREGKSYWGATPLAELVTEKASEIQVEIFTLLDDEKWTSTFSDIQPRFVPKARELVVTLALTLQANYQMRVMDRVGEYPLLFFRMLLSPPEVPCDDRAALAEKLLSLPLVRDFSDFTVKVVNLFRAAFERMCEDGVCSALLYTVLMVCLYALSIDT